MAVTSQLERPEAACRCKSFPFFKFCRAHGWCGLLDGPDDLKWFLAHYPRDRKKILEAARAQGVSEDALRAGS